MPPQSTASTGKRYSPKGSKAVYVDSYRVRARLDLAQRFEVDNWRLGGGSCLWRRPAWNSNSSVFNNNGVPEALEILQEPVPTQQTHGILHLKTGRQHRPQLNRAFKRTIPDPGRVRRASGQKIGTFGFSAVCSAFVDTESWIACLSRPCMKCLEWNYRPSKYGMAPVSK